ncbi:hypothetical protein S2M10_12660 [Sphingomonas sp. S2M10]|jgi:hypothetical protein|uniref:hypothetical protein n=1 Tax=Sphingomonas sp. S2M10 TaxID=2705010 RepID=UPI0014563E87|nr:hypothetical protein [Sphingomonas sp. S2M10]NLS26285.1 hypothetical protein [Sphingomonas sp. S2M10]
MSKLRLMAAAALLMPLAACGGSEGNVADGGNVAPEANAMIYQNDAEDRANAEAEAMIGNAAPDNGAEMPDGNAQ